MSNIMLPETHPLSKAWKKYAQRAAYNRAKNLIVDAGKASEETLEQIIQDIFLDGWLAAGGKL